MTDTRHFRYFSFVPVAEDASMSVPACGDDSLEWALRYAPPTRDASMAAASCLDSYTYLLTACNKEEAWRRIKLLRAAILDQRTHPATAADAATSAVAAATAPLAILRALVAALSA